MLLGHAHPAVVLAVERQLRNGALFGLSTELEIDLAERVRRFYPAAERLRFVSTGTEATTAAIRIARAATKRDGVLKFDGNYHGHADAFLIRGGSGLATFGVPDSAGVPGSVAAETRVASFNDLGSVEAAFAREPGRIAAIIVEPVVGNMGVIPPGPDFLQGLRSICDRFGALLVFDEVMSGFRVARGGAAERYGVQAGTYSGNPLGMAAGDATLAQLETDPAIFRRAEARTTLLAAGLREILTRRKVRGVVNAVGSMWTIFFGVSQVSSVEDARHASREEYARFFQSMLERGILLPPSACESAFLSDAHAETELDRTLEAADEAIEGIA